MWIVERRNGVMNSSCARASSSASIFRAFYEPLKKDVAVKILQARFFGDERMCLRFENEARALARLRQAMRPLVWHYGGDRVGTLIDTLAQGGIPPERVFLLGNPFRGRIGPFCQTWTSAVGL